MQRKKVDQIIEELSEFEMANGKKPTVFDRGEDRVFLSAEHGDGAADYSGGNIDPDLNHWAESRGYFWEWVNPGCLSLCE